MTLVLTLVDKAKIVQVSDRRFTNRLAGETYENKNKAVCVGMSHVHFAASYTGLSYIGSEREENRTDYWLLEHLGAITKDGEPSIDGICRSLAKLAEHTLRRIRGKHKPLEVILAGYDRHNHAFRATVSNFRYNDQGFYIGDRERFMYDVQSFHAWNPMPKLYVTGAKAAFQANDPNAKELKTCRDKVLEHLKVNRERLTEVQVADRLVWLVRAAHTHPNYGHGIGRDCLSVAIFPKSSRRTALVSQTVGYPIGPDKHALFPTFYHPVAATSVHFAPHLADWFGDHRDLEIDTIPEGADPPPPNQPVATNLAVRTTIKVQNLPEGPSEEE